MLQSLPAMWLAEELQVAQDLSQGPQLLAGSCFLEPSFGIVRFAKVLISLVELPKLSNLREPCYLVLLDFSFCRRLQQPMEMRQLQFTAQENLH